MNDDVTDFSDLLVDLVFDEKAEKKKADTKRRQRKNLEKKQVKKQFTYKGYIVQLGVFHGNGVLTWRAFPEYLGDFYLWSHDGTSPENIKKKIDLAVWKGFDNLPGAMKGVLK